jgi:hypothetical protein
MDEYVFLFVYSYFLNCIKNPESSNMMIINWIERHEKANGGGIL